MSAYARHSDPETSKAAAESVVVAPLERMVLDAIRDLGRPATSYDVAERTGLSLVTVSPRFRPLAVKGLIRTAGVDRSSGRPRLTWEVAA